ncbi:hypothetical protein [Bacillus sp. Marseille-Q1617]|nr:hypothetical protein [Bacillus sp. Marseille-Q1617]
MMVWAIIIAIAYLPIIYRIQKRLANLEDEVSRLKSERENEPRGQVR